MIVKLVVIGLLAFYYFAYKWYAGFLEKKVFNVREDYTTPAHKYKDDIDYVPTRPMVLFGHHFASIAGLGPILGPAVAVIWGWFPALLWLVLGAVFIGGVHDYAALVLSVRAKGLSIGSITEYLLGKRAKLLFLIIIFFLVSLAMGVFVIVLGFLFSEQGFPNVINPSVFIMIVALALGYATYKKGFHFARLGSFAFVLVLIFVFLGEKGYLPQAMNLASVSGSFSNETLMSLMLIYAFFASILPVWLLLQSRDFLNSLLLILGLSALYFGFFFSNVEMNAPAIQANPPNAPNLIPFLFITIACGSISGFHALVSSGTTAKQLNNEKDARKIGYGAMLGESLLGLLAILATTTVFSSQAQWKLYYGDWKDLSGLGNQVAIFIKGGSYFLQSLGFTKTAGENVLAFLVVSFALTSLDSATRLLRYNIEELSEYIPVKNIKTIFANRYTSSALAVFSIGFFAFFKLDNMAAGKILWQLFGTSNQLLGGLALAVASVYLYSRGKSPLYTLIPMVFILGISVYSMSLNMVNFLKMPGSQLLIVVNSLLLFLTGWLAIEGLLAIKRFQNNKIKSLDIL